MDPRVNLWSLVRSGSRSRCGSRNRSSSSSSSNRSSGHSSLVNRHWPASTYRPEPQTSLPSLPSPSPSPAPRRMTRAQRVTTPGLRDRHPPQPAKSCWSSQLPLGSGGWQAWGRMAKAATRNLGVIHGFLTSSRHCCTVSQPQCGIIQLSGPRLCLSLHPRPPTRAPEDPTTLSSCLALPCPASPRLALDHHGSAKAAICTASPLPTTGMACHLEAQRRLRTKGKHGLRELLHFQTIGNYHM